MFRPQAACRALVPAALVVSLTGWAAPAAASPPVPPEDATMSVADDLRDADRRFAAAVAAAAGAERAEVWADWFAVDGCQIVPAAVVRGRASIRELMTRAFADPEFTLTWDPDLAEGGPDRGWTSGRYVSTRPGPDGPVRSEGRYLTLWRRDADGTWRVAVDTGVPDAD